MSQFEVEIVPVLSDNYVYILNEPDSGTTAVVDPPVTGPINELLANRGWAPSIILVTHHHPDHVAGVQELKAKYGARVYGPAAEREAIPGIDVALEEGDEVTVGDQTGTVLETPGHTRGHISYWFEESRALLCADTLFALGCGRLFEGTAEQMQQSMDKYGALPDDALVYCGHEYTQSNARFALTVDPNNEALVKRAQEIDRLRAEGRPTVPSTLGEERATNPFLRTSDPQIKRLLKMENATPAEVFGEIRQRKDNS